MAASLRTYADCPMMPCCPTSERSRRLPDVVYMSGVAGSAEPQALQQDAAAAAASEAQAAGFAHQQADILPHAQPQLHVPSPVTHAAQQATQLDDTRPQHASATACVDSATATDDPSAHASVKQTADEAHPMHIDEAIQQEATQQQAAAAEPADSADQHEADDRPDEQVHTDCYAV